MSIAAFKAAAERTPPLQAPYNFVPLNAQVLATPLEGDPDLATPHEDGLSGELVVEWRVETPLLVGGNDNNSPFRLDDDPTGTGDYAIPGASLRGMVRSVLEIMAFAHLDLFTDRRFGFRDYEAVRWGDVQRMPGQPQTIVRNGNEILIQVPRAGWLRRDGDNYRLDACSQEKVPVVALAGTLSLTKDDWHCLSLHDRHALLDRHGLTGEIDLGRISPNLAGVRGTLVVAGLVKSVVQRVERARQGLATPADPNEREKKSETAFLADTGSSWTIGKAAFDAFDAIQVTDGNRRPGPAVENWSYWRPRLVAGERVPVFFRGNPETARNRVPAPTEFFMALTRLMRVPHAFTIADRLARSQEPLAGTALDFVQALFGHVPDAATATLGGKGRQRAWRSRVRFGLARLAQGQTARPLGPRRALTMQPRASYWPFHLRPAPAGGGPERIRHPVDWSSQDSRLAGRKRYPARNHANPSLPRAPNQSDEQENDLVFLDASAGRPLVFRSAIRFHNILPAELGGLVWAIGLGNHDPAMTRRRRHMLGRAKAFGYGQLEARILDPATQGWLETNTGEAPPSLADCAAAFEAWVAAGLGDGRAFGDRPEIATLLALSDAGHGHGLRDQLAFTRGTNGTNDAERILDGYATIKKRAACPPRDGYPDRRGNRLVARDTADDAFLFLPEYPLPEDGPG